MAEQHIMLGQLNFVRTIKMCYLYLCNTGGQWGVEWGVIQYRVSVGGRVGGYTIQGVSGGIEWGVTLIKVT